MKTISKLGHIILGALAGEINKENIGVAISALTQGLGDFSKEELYSIQIECLRMVSKMISDPKHPENPPIPLPVLMEGDRWGVNDLKEDVITVLALTGHVLVFNLIPFFEGESLKRVVESFKNRYTLPSDVLMSMNSPSDQ